ncbi:MAG: hypothetical protein Q9191_005967, partial [Dirinaria sp. TL-2023a]
MDRIVLGSLFALVIIAGIIKVYFSKRRLKKYTKKAEEDALSGGEERVELNKRELDEGDLFGIRAIQSGYFGGVAQSRPSSIAEERSDRDSSASNTLLGSHNSPDKRGPSPMSSVVTLPLEARTASPLRHTVISTADTDRPRTPKRQVPNPIRSTLQPSDAEISGRINHDPAVNMLLNVPPSPGAVSRPSSVGWDSRSSSDNHSPEQTPERSPESSSFPRNSQYGGHYIPTAAPQHNATRDSIRPVSELEYPDHEPQSQHASIISRESDSTIRDNNRSLRSSIQEENVFSTRAVRSGTEPMGRDRSSIQEEGEFTIGPASRPFSTYRPYPSRTSSYGTPGQGPSQAPNDSVPVPTIPHQTSSVVVDRGSNTFDAIDRTTQDSKDASRAHISHLSDSSSLDDHPPFAGPEPSTELYSPYSGTSTARYYTQTMHNDPDPQRPQQQEQPAPGVKSLRGFRRSSDTSSRQTHPSAVPSPAGRNVVGMA